MTNLQPKVCPECQFEESKFMSYKYTPHAPDCSRNKPVSKLQELKKDFEKKLNESDTDHIYKIINAKKVLTHND